MAIEIEDLIIQYVMSVYTANQSLCTFSVYGY